MDKKTSDVVFQITDFVENDLDSLLDIAIMIAPMCPPLAGVVAVIKFLNKHKEKIKLAAGLAKNVSSTAEDSLSASLASSEESRLLFEQKDSKKLFLSLVEDAKADGVVTDEEREYLVPIGRRAGYSLKEIEQMLVIK